MKVFNKRGEWISAEPVHQGVYRTVVIKTGVLMDSLRTDAGPLTQSDVVLTQHDVAGYLCLLATAAGLAIEISGINPALLREEAKRKERQAIVVKRLYLKPTDHDLYATGDTDLPKAIVDSNNEVVLGLCRKCNRAESQLDDHPECDHDYDGREVRPIGPLSDRSRMMIEGVNDQASTTAQALGQWPTKP